MDIENVFISYFENIFQSSNPSIEDIIKVFNTVQIRVSEEMNVELLQLFTREEVKEAFLHMVPLKSLGSDGFSPCFFQPYWKIVGDGVCVTLLNFLNNSVFDENINYT